MKSMIRSVETIAILFLCLLLAPVGGVYAGTVQTAMNTDRELASQYQDFTTFAQSKIKQLNRNHKYSKSRMSIKKLADGTYRARYHKINSSTLKAKVKRSKSKAIPYVGILSYKEEVFESSAPDKNSFDENLFAVVEVIPNRQIFSYQGGTWK